MTRIQINFRFPENVIGQARLLCEPKGITLTDYVLSAIKEKISRDEDFVKIFKNVMREKVRAALSKDVVLKEISDEVLDEILEEVVVEHPEIIR